MTTTRTNEKQALNTRYSLYNGNTLTTEYTLILWGGPHTDNKRYLESFANTDRDRNFLLIEYSEQLVNWFNTIDILDSILWIEKELNIVIKSVIWFSFWAYLTIQLLNHYTTNIEKVALTWFLYKYDQLERVYNNYQEEANKNWNAINLLRRDLFLMWVSSSNFEKFSTDEVDEKLQRYFEDNKYFEDQLSSKVYSNNFKDISFYFWTCKKDKLTPVENIYDFLEDINNSRMSREIVQKDSPHSLSVFIQDICEWLK